MDDRITINLGELERDTLVGYLRGEAYRTRFGLDTPAPDADYRIQVPERIQVISNSFFMGLFEPLIRVFANKATLYRHIDFTGVPARFRPSMDEAIDRILFNKALEQTP